MSANQQGQKQNETTEAKKRARKEAAFGGVRLLTTTAMLTAMSVVLAYLAKLLFATGPIRVTFENLPIIFGGVAFGPVVGGAIAVAADLISCLVAGQGPAPLITVGAASVGIVAGIVGKYLLRRRNYLTLLAIELSAQTLGSVVVKSVALHFHFGIAWVALLPRIPLYLSIAVVEAYLLKILLNNRGVGRLLERIHHS